MLSAIARLRGLFWRRSVMIHRQFERTLLFSLGMLVCGGGCTEQKAAPPAADVAPLPPPLATPSAEAVNQYITKMRNDLYHSKSSIFNDVMQLGPDEGK